MFLTRLSGPGISPARSPVPAASLSFSHVNLCRNPFGELEPAERSVLAVVQTGPWVRRLREPGFALQFLGRKGYGKTTRLLAIMRHFPRGAYVHVGEGQRPRIPHAQPLAVDEIQRLPPRHRRRIFRRPVSLALGSHEDYRDELARAGFSVQTVQLSDSVDEAHLDEILNRRIEWFRRGPGPVPRIGRQTARALADRYGGDIRAIEGRLYELFQQLDEVRDV